MRKYLLITLVFIAIVYFFIWQVMLVKPKGNNSNGFSVNLIKTIDPDIILVNIGNADRSTVARQLMKIDSCQPVLIAIDTYFPDEKGREADSVLMHALQTIKKDVISFILDSNEKVLKSHPKFDSLVADEGLAFVNVINGVASKCTPIETIGGIQYELMPLKIIRQWKPNFKASLKPNQTININYTRTIDQFVHIEQSDIKNIDCDYFKNKVVLVGYLGPGNLDKQFTPIRYFKDFPGNEPDTYGLVIIANQIRTILEYQER